MAMPPGPPGPPPDDAAPQMSPDQAQQVLAKFGIKPEEIPIVAAACEALMPGDDEGGPPAKPGFMEALSQRYQGQ